MEQGHPPQQSRGNLLLQELSDSTTLCRSQENLARLEVLLTDYLVCILHAGQIGNVAVSRLATAGVIGKGAWLALQSNQSDRDDVDWSVGTHPGSVIWSTLFSLGLTQEQTRKNFLPAALAGFRSSASIANFFGLAHRSKWHVTGTAGAFAAASAASVSFGYPHETHKKALQLAGANFGGSVLAPREREGASGFNRSAATTLGMTAAMAASEGVIAVENLWDGPFGIASIFSASDFPADANLTVDGVSTTALRLFPVTGFAQSAVQAAAILSRRNSGQVEYIEIGLPEGAIELLDGTRGGFWWNIRSAVAAAWASRDPSSLTPTTEYIDRVRVVSAQLPFGAASVSTKTPSGEDSETIYSPPGIDFKDPREIQWRNIKWDSMVGERVLEVGDVSKALISGVNGTELWDRVKALIDN